MAKKSKAKKQSPMPEEIETEPDAWERFEHAVDAAVKSGPKHRVSSSKIVPPKKPKPKPKPKKEGGR